MPSGRHSLTQVALGAGLPQLILYKAEWMFLSPLLAPISIHTTIKQAQPISACSGNPGAHCYQQNTLSCKAKTPYKDNADTQIIQRTNVLGINVLSGKELKCLFVYSSFIQLVYVLALVGSDSSLEVLNTRVATTTFS